MGSQSRNWYRTQTKRFIQILWLWNVSCQRSFIQVRCRFQYHSGPGIHGPKSRTRTNKILKILDPVGQVGTCIWRSLDPWFELQSEMWKTFVSKSYLDARKPWKTSKNEIANWKWLASKIKISFNVNSASKWVKIFQYLFLTKLTLGNCRKIRKIISAWERRIKKIFKHSFRSVPKEFGRIRRTSSETFAK